MENVGVENAAQNLQATRRESVAEKMQDAKMWGWKCAQEIKGWKCEKSWYGIMESEQTIDRFDHC